MGFWDILGTVLAVGATIAVVAGAAYLVHHAITSRDCDDATRETAHENNIYGEEIMRLIDKVQSNKVSIKGYNRNGEHMLNAEVKNNGEGCNVHVGEKSRVRA